MRTINPRPPRGTLVFAGAEGERKMEALRRANVDALMFSFESVRKAPERFNALLEAVPKTVRRHLDSGVFSLMVRSGAGTYKSKKGIRKNFDLQGETIKLINEYTRYLTEYGDLWDHVIELDVDGVMGSGASLEYRKQLRSIVGDKLLPVWHITNSEEEWIELCDSFPYLAIGGAARSRNIHLYRQMRHLVDIAHRKRVQVHGLGCGTLKSFLEIGWDTGDCTSWLSGARYGTYHGVHGGLHYSQVEGSGRLSGAKASGFEDFFTEAGIDKAAMIGDADSIERYIAGALMMLRTQAYIQRVYAERGVA